MWVVIKETPDIIRVVCYYKLTAISVSTEENCPLADNFPRPLPFISLSHSDNQSESTTKFYNSYKADVVGNVLTPT